MYSWTDDSRLFLDDRSGPHDLHGNGDCKNWIATKRNKRRSQIVATAMRAPDESECLCVECEVSEENDAILRHTVEQLTAQATKYAAKKNSNVSQEALTRAAQTMRQLVPWLTAGTYSCTQKVILFICILISQHLTELTAPHST